MRDNRAMHDGDVHVRSGYGLNLAHERFSAQHVPCKPVGTSPSAIPAFTVITVVMEDYGYSYSDAVLVIEMHCVAMFLPSFFTGALSLACPDPFFLLWYL